MHSMKRFLLRRMTKRPFVLLAVIAMGPQSNRLLVAGSAVGDSNARAVIDGAARALEGCTTLSFRARYHWSTTGVLGGGDGALDVEAHMARGGKFRVAVARAGEELAGVCCDGAQLTEWSAEKKAWTRYPLADRSHGLRFVQSAAGEPKVGQALARFASTWLDPPSCFTEAFKDAMQKAQRVMTRKAIVGDKACDIIEFRKRRPYGALQAREEASVAFGADTGLPVFEETIVRVKGLMVSMGEETRSIDYQTVTINVRIQPDTFTLAPPGDWEFIALERFRTESERLIGQYVADWEFRSIDGEKVSIREFSSQRPVLLIAWATWCTPCKLELAALRECYQSAEFRRRVHVVAVSADRAAEMVKVFVRQVPLPFTVVHDPEFLARHGLSALPTTLLISKRGQVVRAWGGWPEGGERQRDLVVALAELEADTVSKP